MSRQRALSYYARQPGDPEYAFVSAEDGKGAVNAIYDDMDSTLPGFASVFDVRHYGAVGDGVADDTVAIQAAMTAAADEQAEAFIPAGVWKFSQLVIPAGCLGIRGVGSQVLSQDVFGGSQWDDPVLRGGGTVLKSTATSGAAISCTDRIGPRISNLLLLGPGSGTSVGLSTSDADWVVGLQLRGLSVANFDVGVDLSVTYETESGSLNIRGCGTGLRLRDASNQNTFVQTQVQSCSVGVEVDTSEMNLFSGGLGQVNTGKSVWVHGSGAHGNVFDMWYFENQGVDVAVHFASGADYSEVRNAHGSANVSGDDRVLVDANHCRVINTHLMGVEVNGEKCVTMGTHTLTGVDSPNYLAGFHVDFVGGRVAMRGLDVRMDTGKAIYLETVGTASYLKRSGGEIHLGHNLSVRGPVGFNSTSPLTKPTVTGARDGNAALANLLTALAAYGLITDSTT